MDYQLYSAIMACLTVGGTLFSGYLFGTTVITKKCAFNEPCPIFLGYPACGFGFAFFFAMFVAAMMATMGFIHENVLVAVLTVVSFIGIVFASQYVIPEIAELLSGVKHKYTLGLSTCSYGLLFFIAIFILSVMRYL